MVLYSFLTLDSSIVQEEDFTDYGIEKCAVIRCIQSLETHFFFLTAMSCFVAALKKNLVKHQ